MIIKKQTEIANIFGSKMCHCEVLTNKQISYTHILLRGTCFQNVLCPYFTIIVTSQKNYTHFDCFIYDYNKCQSPIFENGF